MLKGTLDDFTLSDIFRLLSFTKKTGKLEVKRSAGEGNVFFRDGDVYFAQSSLKKEPLGQKLIRSGSLSEAQLLKALDLHASTGQRVGEILLEQGAITQGQLVGAVAEQIEDAAFDLLRWELGEFVFEAHERFEVEIPIAVSVENLIMEASRRLEELDVIQRKIPSDQVILRVAPAPPQGARQINISPEEWRLLVLVDGTRTVGDVCEMAGLDDFSGIRTLYGMISSGLLDIAELGPTQSEEVMLTPPSPVDTGMRAAVEVDEEPIVATEDEPTAPIEDEPTVVRAPEEVAVDEAYEPTADTEDEPTAAIEDEPTAAIEDEPTVMRAPEEPIVATEDEPTVVRAPEEPMVATEDELTANEYEPTAAFEDEPTVVRAPEEVVVDEAYEQIAGLVADFNDEDRGLEEDPQTVPEPPDDATAESLDEDSLVYQVETEGDDLAVEVSTQPAVESYEELLSDFQNEIEAGATEVGADHEPQDVLAPEYSVDNDLVVSDEFVSTNSESTVDEYADTPIEELLGPEIQSPIPDPDLSEVIASGVPDEWFRDPNPTEPEAAPVPPMPPSAPDPFLDDILNGDVSPPPAPRSAESHSGATPGPSVDRAAVVRELAGLFSDEEAPRRARPTASDEAEDEDTTPTGAAKRRVEDDDQINKGLIGRFIDGVKGM